MIQSKFLNGFPKLVVLALGLIALITSCGEKKIDENLQKAFELHKEAVEVRQMAQDQIEQLESNSDSLFVDTYGKDISALGKSLKEWDEQLIEVPGFDEEHDHAHHDHSGHDHGHDHNHHHDQPELTPQQHLEVQQQLLQEIKQLAGKISSIK